MNTMVMDRTSFVKPLCIGTVQLKNNLIMAPMAGITDIPFRQLAKDGGAGLVCSEMISANALAHNDEKTEAIAAVAKTEHPVSVQIFGSTPSVMAGAALFVESRGADIVDINFGCPVRKIARSGAGAKAVENEKNLTAIMEQVVKAVKIPVTIKIRIAAAKDANAAPRIIQLAENSGIKAVTLHGRPAEVLHKGEPDLDAIAMAVESAGIPVIGNGGVTDELSAEEFFKRTRCAGLMIGRGAIGDTEIFRRIEHFMSTGCILFKPSWEYRIALLKKHAAASAGLYGEYGGLIRLRKTAPYYLKGLPNASHMRDRFNHTTTLKELDTLLEEIWQSPYFGAVEKGLNSPDYTD